MKLHKKKIRKNGHDFDSKSLINKSNGNKKKNQIF